MGNQCISPSIRKDKRYKKLQAKYDVAQDDLEDAIYDWANIYNKDIDIDDSSLEEYLDEHFQIKSTNIFSNKREYEKALELWKESNVQEKYNDKVVVTKEKTANRALAERVKYFGKDNVVMYKNQEGKYIIRVGIPVYDKTYKKESSNKKQSKPKEETEGLSKVEKAERKLRAVIKRISSRVKFNPVTHTYTVYDSEKEANNKRTRGSIVATSVSRHIYGNQGPIVGWGTPSSTLGNTNDAVIRDYFAGVLTEERRKKGYPNLTKKQLDNLISDIESLEGYFRNKYGKNCKIITEEFPIAAAYTTIVNGKPITKYMAGTMDMIVIDEDGGFHIFDMKAKRSGLKEGDMINYGNQMGLYGNILESYGIKVEDQHVILSDVWYETPIEIDPEYGVEYTVERDGEKLTQLYADGVPIQESDYANYNGIRLHIPGILVDEYTIVPTELDKDDSKMDIKFDALDPAEDYKSLNKEEKKLMSEEVGDPTKKTSLQYKKSTNKPSKSGLYNPLLSAAERKFLADTAMYIFSHIVGHLKTDRSSNNFYFPDGSFASTDFTEMEEKEIIDTIGVGPLFNIVKMKFFNTLCDISDETQANKLLIAINNFDALIEEGYAKLISLEQVATFTLSKNDRVIEDTGNDDTADDNDSATLEEKEREYWQLGQRHISAKYSLSKNIRRMLEKLPILDSKGRPVLDQYGFGFPTYVDPDTAVNDILEWCNNCTTIEEMETILEEKSEAYPWLNTVLEKIKEEPIRSQFFQNFRKDFTQYSIVMAERASNGKMTYKIHIINTKGVTNTILQNLRVKYASGNLQNIIITNDDFDGLGKVNVKKVEEIVRLKKEITNRLHDAFDNPRTLAKVLEKEAVNITDLLNRLGIDVLSSTVKEALKKDLKIKNRYNSVASRILSKIDYICKDILKQKDRTDYNPMNKEEKKGNTYSDYKGIVEMLEPYIEKSIEASVYEGGKMYYSFVNPSYTGKLMTNLKNSLKNHKKFETFIEEEYKKYRWFWDDKNGNNNQWNNMWLKLLVNDSKARENFDHKVQITFNKTPYRDLSELGYTLAMMQEYFYDVSKNWAWYRIPVLSNKPSAEFIKFRRFSGPHYKQNIKEGFKMTFNQEVLRIKTVLERATLSLDNKSDISKIDHYDIDLKLLENKIGKDGTEALLKRIKAKKFTANDFIAIMKANRSKGKQSGAEFRFLEVFSDEIINNTEVGKLIIKKINDTATSKDEVRLHDLIVGGNNGEEKGLLDTYMDKMVENEIDNWKKLGLFETVERTVVNSKGEKKTITEYKYLDQISNLHELKHSEEIIMHNLEEYVWNDVFATINIIQLTTTDLAYYKNAEDFQKRIAQIHSPALKLNPLARDSKDVPVSRDGKARTIYINDLYITSDILKNLEIVFDRKIARAETESERKELIKTKDFVLTQYIDFNVTDGQAYSSPTSYRKKMIMAGRWDEVQEKAYERIIKGDFNVNDLNVLWQPLKPFVFTQVNKSTGVETMSQIKVSMQNKNSEYMLLMADALMRGEGINSTLGAIFDFMENSARTGRKTDKNGAVIEEGYYNGRGIDTVQFVSAVKVGNMGVIEINDIKGRNPKDTHDKIIERLDSFVYYNEDKSPSDNNEGDIYNDQYVHTFSFEDYGIQQEVPDHLVDHFQSMGSQVRILSVSDISDNATFEIHNVRGTKDKKWILNEYQKLITENIEDSFRELSRELKLNSKNRRERNRALSEILQDAIKKDQKYGNDLLRACKLNDKDEFNIPLNDPIQARRVQELINSIIKSRIYKQTIKGGPVVQTASYGQNLRVVFKDKKTGAPLVIPEAIKKNKVKLKKWLEEHQGELSHLEAYMPIPSEELEKALTKEDGSIMDVDEALEKGIINEEMLKAIGYRI